MFETSGEWASETVVQYLESQEIPLRLGCITPSGYPWILSLWYFYDDGRLVCATSANADVVDYIDKNDQVAFEVSTNDPPYRGVRGRGVARIEPDEDKEVLRMLFERYLGGTDSELASMLLSEERDEVRIIVDLEKVYSWDFSDRMPCSD